MMAPPEQDYLLCSRCPNVLAVTEETFFETAAEWTIRFEAGHIAEVFCEQCREPRLIRRPAGTDDKLRELDS